MTVSEWDHSLQGIAEISQEQAADQLVDCEGVPFQKILLLSEKYLIYKPEYRGMKSSCLGQQFSRCDNKDKEGHLLYLYES